MSTTSLVARFHQLPAPPPDAALSCRQGRLADYAALCEHHYRAERPATATRVMVLEHRAASIAGRFLQRKDQTQVAAVLVESLPALNCRLRDFALHERFGRVANLRQRAILLNAEMRCISRIVVHPQWRGLGLAIRLVREALATATTPFTEALAAMGHVHPFFERAGMTAYRRARHEHDARLIAALASAGFAEIELAATQRLARAIEALPMRMSRWLQAEARRWFRRTLGRSHDGDASLAETLRAARQRLLCEPIYYLRLRTQVD